MGWVLFLAAVFGWWLRNKRQQKLGSLIILCSCAGLFLLNAWAVFVAHSLLAVGFALVSGLAAHDAYLQLRGHPQLRR